MIERVIGNIWDYEADHYIVIPTNIGWRADKTNIMGRGLALQAAKKYPKLPLWYGSECYLGLAMTPVMVYPHAPLILFPVKPLNEKQPWASWKNMADLALIERSAIQLADMKLDREVAIPMVGCGNGKLTPEDVRPILDKYLSDEKFLLVTSDERI